MRKKRLETCIFRAFSLFRCQRWDCNSHHTGRQRFMWHFCGFRIFVHLIWIDILHHLQTKRKKRFLSQIDSEKGVHLCAFNICIFDFRSISYMLFLEASGMIMGKHPQPLTAITYWKSHLGSCKVSATKHQRYRKGSRWLQLIHYARNCSMSRIPL